MLDWLNFKRRAWRKELNSRIDQLLEQGDIGTALAELDRAVQEDSGYWKWHFTQGILLRDNWQYVEALEAFRRAVKLAPLNMLVRWDLAMMLFWRGRFDEALRHFKLTIWRWPRYSDPYTYIGACCLKLRNYEEAEQWFEWAKIFDVTSPYLQSYLALLYQKTQKFDHATEYVNSLIAASPESSVGYYIAGELYHLSLKQPDKAVDYYRKALAHVGRTGQPKNVEDFEEDKDFPRSLIENIIVALTDSNDLDAAESEAQKHLAQYLNRPEAIAVLGYVYLRRGNATDSPEFYEKAAQLYESAIKKLDDFVWRSNLARLYLILKRLEGAEVQAKRSIEINPSYEGAWNVWADILLEQGHYADALPKAEKAVRLEPYNVSCWETLAAIFVRQEDWEQAISPLYKVLELDDTKLWAFAKLGLANAKLGRLENSAEAYRRYLEQVPDDFELWLDLGKVYQRLNDLSEATAALEKALAGELTDEQRREAEGLLAELKNTAS